MNKRGVSQVVSTILILLIVIIAIGIVWVVIERIVRSGGGLVEEKAQCFEVFLEFEEDSVECNVSASDGPVWGSISRGADSVDEIKMKIIVGNNVVDATNVPVSLGIEKFTNLNTTDGLLADDEVTIKVAPVVGEDLDVVCDPTDEEKVTCES